VFQEPGDGSRRIFFAPGLTAAKKAKNRARFARVPLCGALLVCRFRSEPKPLCSVFPKRVCSPLTCLYAA
jgi:hypothetical protein